MTNDEILEKFGVTEDQLDAWEQDAINGIFHGNVREIVVGRPKLTNEQHHTKIELRKSVFEICDVDLSELSFEMPVGTTRDE